MNFKGRAGARLLAVSLLLISAVFMLCSCKVSNKKAIIRYAKEKYGDCEFISEEREGSGNKEKHTVYLRDKDTGIEYKVTSSLISVGLDGTVFGYSEHKSSDFVEKYYAFIEDEAREELSALKKKYGITFDGLNNVLFPDRVSNEDAEKAVKEFSDILKEHDNKGLCPENHLVYAENKKVYIGNYLVAEEIWEASGIYKIIDYVHEHYDSDAKYLNALSGPLNMFYGPEEIDRLIPDQADREGVPTAKVYYFKDKNGNRFVAIDLKEFGAKATDVRLFRDKASGMEEIKY